MMRKAIWWGASAALVVGTLTPAMARPQYLQAFKAHYRTTMGKPTLNAANCAMCHVGAPANKTWNPYGESLRRALGATNVQDRPKIVAAFETIGRQMNAATRQTYAAMIAADRLPASTTGAVVTQPPAAGTAGTWIALFNGVNMDGWTKEGAGNWVVQNGILKYTGGGNGWLRSNQTFTNYAMVVQWRYTTPGTANDSGLFLKARPGDRGNPWPNAPQINMGPMQNFGSVTGVTGTRPRYDLIKPNDWNTYQVTVENGVATLAINGTTAWEMASGQSLTGPGHIGIQAENRALEIFSVWVMPLR